MIHARGTIQTFVIVFFIAMLSTKTVDAASSSNCLKPTDIGIDNILSTRPVRGPLKTLLGRCNLLNDVETVCYFTEKSFSQGALIGLSSGCLKWIYYLNLAKLQQLVKTQSCPR